MKKSYILLFIFILLITSSVDSKIDWNKFTSINQLGVTITNRAEFGHGFTYPAQPNCIYPLSTWRSPFAPDYEPVLNVKKNWNSVNNPGGERWYGTEHLFEGALWIGAIRAGKGDTLVTTGGVDVVSVPIGTSAGFEFFPTISPVDTIRVKSSLSASRYYSPDAISHQDFICDYYDVPEIAGIDTTGLAHTPLGLKVHQETYAWNYPYADAFVIVSYDVTNISSDVLKNVYAGIWLDTTIGNLAINRRFDIYELDNWNFDDDANGFALNDGFGRNTFMMYEWDADGDFGLATSYIGCRILGTSPMPLKHETISYNHWVFRGVPPTDRAKYLTMSNRHIAANEPSNLLGLISVEMAETLKPGETANFTIALVCGSNLTNLYLNSNWAQQAYDGEDKNGNNILDPGEDTPPPSKYHNGKLDRYVLPAPPPSPRMKVITGNHKAKIYWDDSPESELDPSTGNKDFEGYKVYRYQGEATPPTCFNLTDCYELLAQFDQRGSTEIGGIFKKQDTDMYWKSLNNNIEETRIADIVAESNTTLYAASRYGGVYKTTDGGNSWIQMNSGLDNLNVNTLCIDPTNSQILYAGTEGGIYKSTNGGNLWKLSNNGIPGIIQIQDLLAVSGSTIYAGTNIGVYKSTDSGANWNRIGLYKINVRKIIFDQKNPSNLYIATNKGIFKSTNGGTSWNSTAPIKLGTEIITETYSLAFEPTDSWLYVGTSDGLFISTNLGTTWTSGDTTVQRTTVQSIAISPNDKNIIYFGTNTSGVYRSTNKGISNTIAINDSLRSTDIREIIFTPNNNVFVATWYPVSPGYNTGLKAITLSQPKVIDGITYRYMFEVENLRNGFPYHFAVTSFDQGDPTRNLPSLESGITQNDVVVYPGTEPVGYDETSYNDPPDEKPNSPGVYPNPYRAYSTWDQQRRTERERKLYFTNLPKRCTIRIYTLAGDHVKTIEHNDPYKGEAAWDLITEQDQAIATGLYIYSVEDLDTKKIKVGKFLVIK